MKHAAVGLALAAAVLPGCLQRYIVVTSEPAGALVELNGVEVGRTPTRTAFTYYGDYDLRLRLDGHQPVHDQIQAKAPWYEWPGLDILASLWPGEIVTTVEKHVPLTPSPEAALGPEAAAAELLDRAATMRADAATDPLAPR